MGDGVTGGGGVPRFGVNHGKLEARLGSARGPSEFSGFLGGFWWSWAVAAEEQHLVARLAYCCWGHTRIPDFPVYTGAEPGFCSERFGF